LFFFFQNCINILKYIITYISTYCNTL